MATLRIRRFPIIRSGRMANFTSIAHRNSPRKKCSASSSGIANMRTGYLWRSERLGYNIIGSPGFTRSRMAMAEWHAPWPRWFSWR